MSENTHSGNPGKQNFHDRKWPYFVYGFFMVIMPVVGVFATTKWIEPNSIYILLTGILIILLFFGLTGYSLYLFNQKIIRDEEKAEAREKRTHEENMLVAHIGAADEKKREREAIKSMTDQKELLIKWMETQKTGKAETETEKEIWNNLGTALKGAIRDIFSEKNQGRK